MNWFYSLAFVRPTMNALASHQSRRSRVLNAVIRDRDYRPGFRALRRHSLGGRGRCLRHHNYRIGRGGEAFIKKQLLYDACRHHVCVVKRSTRT
jgi:hypothetical protein